jgi:two-component system KDP operon response regulator KdpE
MVPARSPLAASLEATHTALGAGSVVGVPATPKTVDVLRVFISQLRRKIERDPSRPQLIATDPDIGYRWLLRPAEDPS